MNDNIKDNRFITVTPPEFNDVVTPPEFKSQIPVYLPTRTSNASAPKTPLTGNSVGKPNSTALNTMYMRPDTSKLPDISPDDQPFQFNETKQES